MPDYHTQPQPTWRDRFTERELHLIANCRQYAENDPAGLPGHQLMLIIARLADMLDTLPLHEVSPDAVELLSDYFYENWQQGKRSELRGEEDQAGCRGTAVTLPNLACARGAVCCSFAAGRMPSPERRACRAHLGVAVVLRAASGQMLPDCQAHQFTADRQAAWAILDASPFEAAYEADPSLSRDAALALACSLPTSDSGM